MGSSSPTITRMPFILVFKTSQRHCLSNRGSSRDDVFSSSKGFFGVVPIYARRIPLRPHVSLRRWCGPCLVTRLDYKMLPLRGGPYMPMGGF